MSRLKLIQLKTACINNVVSVESVLLACRVFCDSAMHKPVVLDTF